MSVIPAGLAAFGLICSGSYNTAKIDPKAHLGLSDYVFEKQTHKLQIDLTAGRWCSDRCEAVERIAASNTRWIQLASVKTADQVRVISIDRQTGDFLSSIRGRGRDAQAQAVCRVIPFRGFKPAKS